MFYEISFKEKQKINRVLSFLNPGKMGVWKLTALDSGQVIYP
jgi:hypothetical protein